MTLAEAKDTKRWWLQNSYKHKGEEIPANVTEAMRILDSGSTTASATIKVLNSAPQLSQAVGFSTVKAEAEPVPSGGLAEWVAEVQTNAPTILKNGRQVVQDKFTPELDALTLERKTASPERLVEITKEQMRIYNKRLALKKKGIVSQVAPFKAVSKPKQVVNLNLDKPVKPSQLPKIIQSEPVEIPPAPAPVSTISPVVQWLHLQQEIAQELAKAEAKHPNWPTNLIKQAAIVSEEAGELIRATLLHEDEGGQPGRHPQGSPAHHRHLYAPFEKHTAMNLTDEQQSQLLSLVLHPNITNVHVLRIRDIIREDNGLAAGQYISVLCSRLGAGKRYFNRFPPVTSNPL
jgi:hypothetical protein